MAPPSERPTVPPLTSLRFFAAMVVLIFHYDPDKFSLLPGFFQSWLETGYEAVTFFFILSGFILSYVYAEADFSRRGTLRAFFFARIGRLAPAYYVALLVALPFYLEEALGEGDLPLRELGLHMALVLTGFQAWWPDSATVWNPPAWSMSVEWFFYLLFPLALFATRRMAPTLLLPAALLLVAAVSGFRIWVMNPLVDQNAEEWANLASFFPLFHLPQFLFGLALGRVYLLGPRPSSALAAGMFPSGAIGLMILFIDLDMLPDHVRSNAVLVVFFGLLIYGAATSGHFAYRALSPAPLVFLGNASYAIYALHEPIALWWDAYGPAKLGYPLPTWADFPLYTGLVILLAALCYRYVETPLRRRIRRWGGAPERRAAFSGARKA